MARRLTPEERGKLGVLRLFRPRSRFGTNLRVSTLNNLVRGFNTQIREENIRRIVSAYDSQNYQFSYIIQVVTPNGEVFTHSTPFTDERRVYENELTFIENRLLRYFNVQSIDEIPDELIVDEGIRVENLRTNRIEVISFQDPTPLQSFILDGIDELIG